MSRQNSIPNGARPIMTQTFNVPQQQHNGGGPQQLVRAVPAQRPSPGAVPAKLQPDFGPNPARLQTSSPSVRRPPAARQLPKALAVQQRLQNLQQPPPIAPQSQAALMSFLDSAFRSSAERIQSELANMRTACTRAIFREQQDKERWRRHCVTFKQERDLARERVRALIVEREAHMAQAAAGTSAEGECTSESERARNDGVVPAASRDSTPTAAVLPSPDDDANLYSFAYPSPTFPPLTDVTPSTLDLPPPRCRSADAVLHRNYTAAKKRDRTAFDVTVTENPVGERRIQPVPIKKRRRRDSLSKASDSSSSTAVEENIPELRASPTDDSRKDAVGAEDTGVHDITNKVKAAHVDPSTPPPKPATPRIELTHVDLMYVPTNGKLVCRACLLHCSKLPQSSRPAPKSFPTNAQWDVLRNHCMTQHPAECADVARLHPAEVYELRRRLMTMR